MAAAALQLKRKAEEEEEEETERLGKQRERFPELSGLYKPTESLGQGTYAVVWRAHVLHGDAEGSEVAVKRFKTQHNKLSRLQNEAQMLIQCRDGTNVVALHKIVRKDEKVAFILPYFPHDSFRDNLHRFDVQHTLRYIGGLFAALTHVHACGVVHRDVKPSNALYSFERREMLLVDFGLAERMREPPATAPKPRGCARPASASVGGGAGVRRPHGVSGATRAADTPSGAGGRVQYIAPKASLAHANTPGRLAARAALAECALTLPRSRAGTKGFRAPECLLGHEPSSGAVDVWAAGVTLLSILSRVYPFFNGADDIDQLWEIAVLRGRRPMQAAARELGRSFKPTNGPHDAMGSCSYVPDDARPLADVTRLSLDVIPSGIVREALLDLTDACLDVNARTRITARMASARVAEIVELALAGAPIATPEAPPAQEAAVPAGAPAVSAPAGAPAVSALAGELAGALAASAPAGAPGSVEPVSRSLIGCVAVAAPPLA